VIEKGRRERVVPFGVQTLRWLRRYVAAAGLALPSIDPITIDCLHSSLKTRCLCPPFGIWRILGPPEYLSVTRELARPGNSNGRIVGT
jgi:site-specific recombinase XerD